MSTTYAYRAIDADGNKAKGRIDSDTLYQARSQLAAAQLSEIEVKKHHRLNIEVAKKKVKREEVMHFSRQLAAFVRAGVPIIDAIAVIAKENRNERFRGILYEVCAALRDGEPFAWAMAGTPDIFPPYYIDILRSAELTGGLDTVLDQLAEYMERDLEARRKLTGALMYPGIVTGMAIVTVIILTSFVLPRFRTFFKSFHAKLPLPTRILIFIGDVVGNWWWAILAGILTVALGLFLFLRTEKGKWRRDVLMLHVYVVGSVVRFAILERFCRILAGMVKAGVPLPEAMAVAADTSGNRVFKLALAGARQRMIDGEGLAGPLDATGLFPGVASQMLRVGEETGTLDDQLQTASEFYGIELDYKVKRLTTLFEPAVIVFVGLLVGGVAVALISAMYGIFQQVKF